MRPGVFLFLPWCSCLIQGKQPRVTCGIGQHMQGADLLEVKLSEKILLRLRVQLAGDKESPLFNREVNLT